MAPPVGNGCAFGVTAAPVRRARSPGHVRSLRRDLASAASRSASTASSSWQRAPQHGERARRDPSSSAHPRRAGRGPFGLRRRARTCSTKFPAAAFTCSMRSPATFPVRSWTASPSFTNVLKILLRSFCALESAPSPASQICIAELRMVTTMSALSLRTGDFAFLAMGGLLLCLLRGTLPVTIPCALGSVSL